MKRRTFYIMKSDIESFGVSPGCSACQNAFLGLPIPTGHMAACRQRILELLRASDRDADVERVEAYERRNAGFKRGAGGDVFPAA